jgi:hypothetical protein
MTALAQTLNDTKTRPMGWKEGDRSLSAAANITKPRQTQKAQVYSTEENIFSLTIEATITLVTNILGNN